MGPQRCLRDQRKINENYVTVVRKGWLAVSVLSTATLSESHRLLTKKEKKRRKGCNLEAPLPLGNMLPSRQLARQNRSDRAKHLGSPGQYNITCWGWLKLQTPESPSACPLTG